MDINGSNNEFVLLNKSSCPTVIVDLDFQPIFVNEKALQLLEMDGNLLLKTSLRNLFEFRKKELQQLEKLSEDKDSIVLKSLFNFNENESEFINLDFQICKIMPHNEKHYFVEMSPANGGQIDGSHIQKLGTYTGKISHDISNPLAVMKMQAENFRMLASRLDTVPTSDVIKRLGTLSDAANKISDHVLSLKELSRTLSGYDSTNLGDFLDRVLEPPA